MNLYKWSTTAANNNSAVPDGAPDGWTGANVNEWARETMAAARAQASDAAYIDETYQLASVGTKSLTRISTTQFKVLACDATSHFTTDRRIKIVGATTDYGFVTSSSYGAPDTTVNVTMDSADVPTSPTQALVHVDTKIRGSAYKKAGSGNGLDSDTLDTYHASGLFGPSLFAEALVNGSFLVWQRGASSTSATAGSRTLRADRWYTNPTGAAVTVARTATTPTGAVSPYALLVTGATSVTTCIVAGQRVESYLMPYVKTTVTISALVKNDTGASLTLSLLLGTPTGADNFTTVNNRLTQSLTAIADTASQRVSYTVDISGYTDINNGLQVEFQAPSGALNAGTKSITITEIQIDRASSFTFFRFRPFPDEILRCQRYYNKTFDYGTVPASAVGFTGTIGMRQDDANNCAIFWSHGPMRSTPTITTFNPSAAGTGCRNTDNTGTKALVSSSGGTNNSYAVFSATDPVGPEQQTYHVHMTAEAEL